MKEKIEPTREDFNRWKKEQNENPNVINFGGLIVRRWVYNLYKFTFWTLVFIVVIILLSMVPSYNIISSLLNNNIKNMTVGG